ncbi:bifunctional metallophosphatase/5'-nucleotidase [Neobacillus mesonae]|uniref:bifunctional metallophosphatase/5'-nucleotidase n=1 Tax=Neobacillus mesonae TaxID=1193713 RepID=UPI00257230F9|nr:bifunctional UDP-sugar hydrolase/5'-nucleotidase [Neobacillus mesonae]MED4204651.1 bifunctional UDP-sugar hydrolase/5'-nucleotidase [Neobacillus mesonae]
MEKIHLYHTNDIHSHLEHWPRIQQFLKQTREQHTATDEEVFLFDIGDFIDRWHPLTDATMGRENIHLLNENQYTAITIGNNEGVNLPHEELNHLYDDAHFDVLVANFYHQDGRTPNWARPYKIYQTRAGTKLGVIGLTANFSHLYGLLGWECTDPFLELKKWIKEVKSQADIVILLSHLGLGDDERLAEEFPELDIILGAHTHHMLEKGELIHHTLLGAAGKFGYYVGHITVEVNRQKEIANKEAILYEIDQLPSVENEEEQIQTYLDAGKNLMQNKVTTLDRPLECDPFKETKFTQILSQAVREWCDSDCAMINAGLLLGRLSGEVTEYDLLSICPHPINPCVVKLTGYELQKVLTESLDETLHNREIKGLGFRGTVLGIFVYDQIEFRSGTIFVGSEAIDQSKTYTLALPDMFTFGHFFKDVLPAKEKKYFLPEFLRDILKWKLEN